MRVCWSYQPEERPVFTEIVEELDRILTITANEVRYDQRLNRDCFNTPSMSNLTFDCSSL